MKFYLFELQADAHIRKSREYLEEAYLKRVEHEAAAEHHGALSAMYAQRIDRIEAEIREAAGVRSNTGQPVENPGSETLRMKSDSVVAYPSRASHA